MPPSARLGSILLLGLVAGCGVGLEHGLEEREANEVLAALERAGIGADKQGDEAQGKWKVVVSRGEAGRAYSVLEARSLPRRTARGVGEAFASEGILPSATAERARLAAALGVDLERTLRRLPGVAGARVHVALPEEDPLRGDGSHPRMTASVLLQVTGANAVVESEVRRLVAGAVEGLQATDVAVVQAPAPTDDAQPQLAPLGPIRVAAESRGLATGLVTATLSLVLILALLVVWGAFRLGALRRRVREIEGDAS